MVLFLRKSHFEDPDFLELKIKFYNLSSKQQPAQFFFAEKTRTQS